MSYSSRCNIWSLIVHHMMFSLCFFLWHMAAGWLIASFSVNMTSTAMPAQSRSSLSNKLSSMLAGTATMWLMGDDYIFFFFFVYSHFFKHLQPTLSLLLMILIEMYLFFYEVIHLSDILGPGLYILSRDAGSQSQSCFTYYFDNLYLNITNK